MKIDEFIKRVNEIFYAEYSFENNEIYIYRTEQDMIDENKDGDDTYYFMNVKLCKEKFSLFIDPDWMPDDVKGLSLLFNLLRELEETPVKERFPEKRYRLRWLDDKDGTPEYIYLTLMQAGICGVIKILQILLMNHN
ncbi:hypothetical protein [Limosilactobacillus caviae]|uniref:Uncharacterized protein n=1 Tax=Limosilactobacillus caviae TaxID=1769424 RepID=A0ABQ2C603_9LACO|nr:hypothetical protein [Limosilactobacillus caviae]GGI63817.1 hypothetical protein GCM10011459_16510 [Limosilactobacillus caviae]